MYEIDTEAEATVSATAAEPSEEEPPPPAPAPAAEVAAVATAAFSAGTRIPSIKFLGRDGWAAALAPAPTVLYTLPSDYGRPEFTEEEMEALATGGANLAPDVKMFSSGAKFGY